MGRQSDRDYFTGREASERVAATAAIDPAVKRLHLKMARLYAVRTLQAEEVELDDMQPCSTGAAGMSDYIMRRNIARFEKALESESDPGKIATLKDLLKIEKAKRTDYHRGR